MGVLPSRDMSRAACRILVSGAALVVQVMAITIPGAAQCIGPLGQHANGDTVPECPQPERRDGWSPAERHALTFGINAAIGGLTSGVRAKLSGRPVGRAFLQGALGGAVAYGGKRIIGSGRYGMGLLGREIAAVGASVVRNAGEGRSPMAGLVLPVGPIRFYINEPHADGVGRSAVRLRLDVATTIGIGYYLTRPGAKLDLAATVSAGAPVFTNLRPGKGPIHIAEQAGGVVALVSGLSGFQRERAITHEVIHVAQYDFAFVVWSAPAERALWRATFGDQRGLGRYLDLGLNEPVRIMLGQFIPHANRPWEREASLLTDYP